MSKAELIITSVVLETPFPVAGRPPTTGSPRVGSGSWWPGIGPKVTAGTTVGSHRKLKVSPTKSNKVLPRAKTTIVKRAGVNPSGTDSPRSVTATCSLKPSPLKSSRLCKVTTTRSTGKVTNKPRGWRGTKVKVTIPTKALVPSVYREKTWKKTWTVK